MLKSYRIAGYAVNKRGNTLGIQFNINADTSAAAVAQAKQQATQDGYSNIRINYVVEVTA
ncbi:TPA: hypothetical protein KEY88_003575 [Serratia marcescens]|nr:hypothetical protein [Serratia marcescens]